MACLYTTSTELSKTFSVLQTIVFSVMLFQAIFSSNLYSSFTTTSFFQFFLDFSLFGRYAHVRFLNDICFFQSFVKSVHSFVQGFAFGPNDIIEGENYLSFEWNGKILKYLLTTAKNTRFLCAWEFLNVAFLALAYLLSYAITLVFTLIGVLQLETLDIWVGMSKFFRITIMRCECITKNVGE